MAQKQKLQVRLECSISEECRKAKVTRKGGRFVLEPKTKKDEFWSHAILGLKVEQKVYTRYKNLIKIKLVM